MTAANFPHMVNNFLRPPKSDQICGICHR